MSYSFIRTNSQALLCSSAPITTIPMTLAAWILPTTDAEAGASRTAIAVGASNGHRNQLIYLSSTGGSIRLASVGSTTSAFADTTVTSPINTWVHGCAVISSSTSRTAYLNGGNSVTNSTSVGTYSVFDRLSIGAQWNGSSYINYHNGSLAEVGVWSAALTANEIASLARGLACNKIRPQALVFYAPLIRNLVDLNSNLIITNTNGATVSDHPRIYL